MIKSPASNKSTAPSSHPSAKDPLIPPRCAASARQHCRAQHKQAQLHFTVQQGRLPCAPPLTPTFRRAVETDTSWEGQLPPLSGSAR